MSSVPLDNPAGRLHRIMSGVLETDPDQQVLQTIRNQLDINEQPYDEMMVSIARFVELAPQTYIAVQALENENADILLRWQPKFNKVVPFLLRGTEPVRVVQQLFNHADLFALENCADVLHRRLPEVTFEDDKIPALVDLVREAIDAISSDTSLPSHVRMELVDRLREVERALSYIHVAGYGGVQDAWDKFTGTIVRTEAHKSGKITTFCSRFMAAVGLAATNTKAVSGAVESAVAAIEAVNSLSN